MNGVAVNIFMICSVRGATEEEIAAQRADVEKLETEGHKVHWPPRDTDQSDPVGLRICQDNRQAIEACDVVRIRYKKVSIGSMFDYVMARALGKQIELANTDKISFLDKSLIDFIIKSIREREEVAMQWDPSDSVCIAVLGIAFALRKNIILLSPETVKPTPHKSFTNVVLALTGNL